MNACLEREPPKYLLRDRDSIFGCEFSRRVRSLGVRDIKTPVHAPKANAFAERFVGTLRRECLDHTFIFNERHLQRIVDEFVGYYNHQRPHRSLNHRPPCPISASTGPPRGAVIAEPVLGGLHHAYRRAAWQSSILFPDTDLGEGPVASFCPQLNPLLFRSDHACPMGSRLVSGVIFAAD